MYWRSSDPEPVFPRALVFLGLLIVIGYFIYRLFA
jgi:hypothetical protein